MFQRLQDSGRGFAKVDGKLTRFWMPAETRSNLPPVDSSASRRSKGFQENRVRLCKIRRSEVEFINRMQVTHLFQMPMRTRSDKHLQSVQQNQCIWQPESLEMLQSTVHGVLQKKF
ncbi:hypothetical protein NPIL_456691 [Nephila pilipes]|uniref:Uncharacterized protein n=1 Tax=Nephila pilipes TaxID=299642 RepID=A0A8X6PHG7_NEPPI|nr:hypothetical protein NPIL_456691 [Nephila pilipes]